MSRAYVLSVVCQRKHESQLLGCAFFFFSQQVLKRDWSLLLEAVGSGSPSETPLERQGAFLRLILSRTIIHHHSRTQSQRGKNANRFVLLSAPASNDSLIVICMDVLVAQQAAGRDCPVSFFIISLQAHITTLL